MSQWICNSRQNDVRPIEMHFLCIWTMNFIFRRDFFMEISKLRISKPLLILYVVDTMPSNGNFLGTV